MKLGEVIVDQFAPGTRPHGWRLIVRRVSGHQRLLYAAPALQAGINGFAVSYSDAITEGHDAPQMLVAFAPTEAALRVLLRWATRPQSSSTPRTELLALPPSRDEAGARVMRLPPLSQTVWDDFEHDEVLSEAISLLSMCELETHVP